MAAEWKKVEEVTLRDEGVRYLVKTNGGEWRDNDLFIWPAIRIRASLEPHIVRGRAVWIAEIIDPTSPSPPSGSDVGKIRERHETFEKTYPKTAASQSAHSDRAILLALIARLEAENAEKTKALHALVAKIDDLTPGINAMFQMATIHGAHWDRNKNWVKEMENARAALSPKSQTNGETAK